MLKDVSPDGYIDLHDFCLVQTLLEILCSSFPFTKTRNHATATEVKMSGVSIQVLLCHFNLLIVELNRRILMQLHLRHSLSS